jgi:hypothetical protein
MKLEGVRENLDTVFEHFSTLPPNAIIQRWDTLKCGIKRTLKAAQANPNQNTPLGGPSLGREGNQQDVEVWRAQLRQQLKTTIALRRANIDKTKGLPSKFLSQLEKEIKPPTVSVIKTKGPSSFNEDIVEAFHEFYSTLYAEKPSHVDPSMMTTLKLPRAIQRNLGPPPSEQELTDIIGQMDKGSSPGPDGLPYSVYSSISAIKALQTLTSTIWETGEIPTSWRDSLIRPLPKEDKDPSLVQNYRPIALINCDSKIITAILNQRLMPFLVEHIPQFQTGFIKGRSTEQSILRLSIYLRKDRKLRALLLDFEKAYDRISHKWLQHILEPMHFPQHIINLIININRGSAKLIINNTLSRPVPLLSGVKQGDPLSPTLFILCLLPLLEQLHKKDILCQAHAGDTAILLRSSKDLSETLRLLSVFEQASGQKVNMNKCTLLAPKHERRFQGHPFAQLLNDRYLGINLHWDGEVSLLPHTKNRYLNPLRKWKNFHLNLKERVTILKAYLRPRILYQLPYTNQEDINWAENAEHWFLQCSDTPLDETKSQRPLVSAIRGSHIRTLWGLLPLDTEVNKRSLGIVIAFQKNNPSWSQQKTEGPLQRLQQQANGIRKDLNMKCCSRDTKERLGMILSWIFFKKP